MGRQDYLRPDDGRLISEVAVSWTALIDAIYLEARRTMESLRLKKKGQTTRPLFQPLN
jgi:hypothetical protein